MEGIRVISATTVQAPSCLSGADFTDQKIELAPYDLAFIPTTMIQKCLVFHKPKPTAKKDTSNNSIQIQIQIQRLKESLSSALSFFPPLAGRLAIVEHQDDTVSASIVCNNEGALFVHAVADNTTVADILKPNYTPVVVRSLFPLNGVKNHQGTWKPLLAVQVTELADGGIIIGCEVNHVIADGNSFWHFINSWAQIARGSDKPSKLPALQRWILEGIHAPIRIPFTLRDDVTIPHPPPVRIFHFSKEIIAKLKSKANAEVTSSTTSDDKNIIVSSLQALLSHFWRCVIRSQMQNLDPQENTSCLVIIDLRPRIRQHLQDNYFGNAIIGGVVTMTARELLECGFSKAALEINKVISLHSSEEDVKGKYESWVRNPWLHKPSGGKATDLLFSHSPRFDYYGNDFGWGNPVAVRSGTANKVNGNVTLFAGAQEGSVDVEVCLPYEILETMGNDPELLLTHDHA